MINKERFEYDSFNESIYDNLTDKHYRRLPKITKLLNQQDERANKNAERLDDYLEYESTVKQLEIIMNRYSVDDFDELESRLEFYVTNADNIVIK